MKGNDKPGGTRGAITLIGSGELGESMARVHRKYLSPFGASPNAVFLDTPAGFEVNANEIAEKAAEYFQLHFDLPLRVASFRSKSRATAFEVEEALHSLLGANYILAGPGSPTYAVRNWRGSPVWEAVEACIRSGAHLTLASAAAIAAGSYALPVYEIFKAGLDPSWAEGLGLFESLDLRLAVIPHWNNTEGSNGSTRYCYMGAERLRFLEQRLPSEVVILGIDEHTAITLDPKTRQGIVDGVSSATVRYAGQEWAYPSGETIPFDLMQAAHLQAAPSLRATGDQPSSRSPRPPTGAPQEAQPSPPSSQLLTTKLYLNQIARAIGDAGEPGAQRELIDHAHETMHELTREWQAGENGEADKDITPLVELLVKIRSDLRASHQFAFADQIRERLGALGIRLEDTPTGTRWKKS